MNRTTARLFTRTTPSSVLATLSLSDTYLSSYGLAWTNPSPPHRLLSPVPEQNFHHHVYRLLPYVVSTMDTSVGYYLFTITWLLHNFHLLFDTEIAIRVMDRLLDTPLSPLYRLLTESRLGEDVIGHGLDRELLEGMFAVGMRGVREECVD